MKQLFFKILNNTEMYSKQNFPIAYYPEVIFFKHLMNIPLYIHLCISIHRELYLNGIVLCKLFNLLLKLNGMLSAAFLSVNFSCL